MGRISFPPGIERIAGHGERLLHMLRPGSGDHADRLLLVGRVDGRDLFARVGGLAVDDQRKLAAELSGYVVEALLKRLPTGFAREVGVRFVLKALGARHGGCCVRWGLNQRRHSRSGAMAAVS
jgi:hypothetical protein